jgi:hypothetical protein
LWYAQSRTIGMMFLCSVSHARLLLIDFSTQYYCRLSMPQKGHNIVISV